MTSRLRTGSDRGQVLYESAPECSCGGLGVMLVSGARGSRAVARSVVCSCPVGKFVAVMDRFGIDVPALRSR